MLSQRFLCSAGQLLEQQGSHPQAAQQEASHQSPEAQPQQLNVHQQLMLRPFTTSLTSGVALFCYLDASCVLQVVFSDNEGSYAQAAQQQQPAQESEAQTQPPSVQQQQTLHPQKWSTVFVNWRPRRPGKVKAQAVVAYTGDTSAMVWSLDHMSPGRLLLRHRSSDASILNTCVCTFKPFLPFISRTSLFESHKKAGPST